MISSLACKHGHMILQARLGQPHSAHGSGIRCNVRARSKFSQNGRSVTREHSCSVKLLGARTRAELANVAAQLFGLAVIGSPARLVLLFVLDTLFLKPQ